MTQNDSTQAASTHFADAQDLLQRHKVRLTFTRIATMASLLEAACPLGVDAIFNRLSGTNQPVSRASVYRALTEFHKLGLATQGWEDIESGRMVYARAPALPPLSTYQVRCTACGGVMHIHDKLFAQQLYHHACRSGFERDLNNIRILVLCNACAEPGKEAAGATRTD